MISKAESHGGGARSEESTIATPVLIVGGGPVGLALALELGWHNVECILVEQSDGIVSHAKFVDINMRTMELCRRWGLADEIRDEGVQ